MFLCLLEILVIETVGNRIISPIQGSAYMALADIRELSASLVLRLRLQEFYEKYCIKLDQLDLESWSKMFDNTARYEITSRENYSQGLPYATMFCEGLAMIKDRAEATVGTVIFEDRVLRRFVSCLEVVDRTGDELSCHANFLVTESIAENESRIIAVGQYVDLIREMPNGEFVILRRQCVVDNYWLPRSFPLPI